MHSDYALVRIILIQIPGCRSFLDKHRISFYVHYTT